MRREKDLDKINELRKQVNDIHVEGRPDVFKAGFGNEIRDLEIILYDGYFEVGYQKLETSIVYSNEIETSSVLLTNIFSYGDSEVKQVFELDAAEDAVLVIRGLNEVVGDGVCFSSVHGSTAYYRSITRGVFQLGVGLAFSNSTESVDHLVLSEKSIVTVEILRGPGLVMADNDPHKITVEVGESITLKQTDEYAMIWNLDGFMCPRCRSLRHHLLSVNEK